MKLFKFINFLILFIVLPLVAQAQVTKKLIGEVTFDQIENEQKVFYNLKLFQISKEYDNDFELTITAKTGDKETENVLQVEKGNHHLQFYKNWSGKDLTDDGKAEIVFEFESGGNCNICSGLSVYTIYQSQLQKIEIDNKINGADFALKDIQEDSNVPLIVGRNFFRIDGFSSADQPSLAFVLKWNEKEKAFQKALDTNLSQNFFLGQSDAASNDLIKHRNSYETENISGFYLAHVRLALISKYLLTSAQYKNSEKDFSKLNYDALKYNHKKCISIFESKKECDELSASIKKFFKSQNILFKNYDTQTSREMCEYLGEQFRINANQLIYSDTQKEKDFYRLMIWNTTSALMQNGCNEQSN